MLEGPEPSCSLASPCTRTLTCICSWACGTAHGSSHPRAARVQGGHNVGSRVPSAGLPQVQRGVGASWHQSLPRSGARAPHTQADRQCSAVRAPGPGCQRKFLEGGLQGGGCRMRRPGADTRGQGGAAGTASRRRRAPPERAGAQQGGRRGRGGGGGRARGRRSRAGFCAAGGPRSRGAPQVPAPGEAHGTAGAFPSTAACRRPRRPTFPPASPAPGLE